MRNLTASKATIICLVAFGLVAALTVFGCAPSKGAIPVGSTPTVAAAEDTSTLLPEESRLAASLAQNAESPIVRELKLTHTRDENGYAPALVPVHRTSAQLRRSMTQVLDPLVTPAASVDVAPRVLALPGVRAALARRLQVVDDVGYPGSGTDPHFLTTSVFKPYGALPFTEDPSRYRIYGVVTDMTWRLLGALPSAHSSSGPWVAWFDVEVTPEPKVTELVSLGDLYLLPYSDSTQLELATYLPNWVVARLYATPTTQDDFGSNVMEVPGANDAMVRLVNKWTAKHTGASLTEPLPSAWTPRPHSHFGSAKQLASGEIARIFQRVRERDLDEDSLYGGDTVGPEPDGPVRTDFTTYNDIIDYHVLINSSTKRVIEVTGFSSFENPVFKGDLLIIDLLVDGYYGETPTFVHCEVDWKTMRVLRAVPYGPLSPY